MSPSAAEFVALLTKLVDSETEVVCRDGDGDGAEARRRRGDARRGHRLLVTRRHGRVVRVEVE